jgi:hypothetical protein
MRQDVPLLGKRNISILTAEIGGFLNRQKKDAGEASLNGMQMR